MKQNWQIKKLGEVCEINIGRTPERGNSRFWDKEKKTQNVWLSIADLNNAENGYVSDSSEYVSDMAVPKMKLVKANTLLMSFKLTIGRCAITKRDLFTNEAIAALPIQTKDLDLFFLKYYLESFNWDKLTEGDTKVKGKTLNKEKLNVVPIVVPPLEEQKRIVAVLDKKFAQIETLKTAAEKNLQNTKQLFQEELEKAFSNTSWEKKRLEDICDKIVDGTHNSPTNTRTGDYKYITAKNIKPTGIDLSDITYVTKEIHQSIYSRCNPEKGDVLLIKDGATTGIAVVNELEYEFSLLSSVALLKPNKKILNSYCLAYLLNSDQTYKQFRAKMEGAAITRLTLVKIKNFEIPLPPLEGQKRIVAHLDSLSEKVHQLEEIYTKQLADCEELKQSLLQKAFDGELS